MLQNSEGMVDNSKISVEFSVGFRLGHTMIPDRVAGMTIGDIFNGQVCFQCTRIHCLDCSHGLDVKKMRFLESLLQLSVCFCSFTRLSSCWVYGRFKICPLTAVSGLNDISCLSMHAEVLLEPGWHQRGSEG